MKKNFYFLMVVFPIFIILFISFTVFLLGNEKFSKIIENYNNYIENDFLNDNKKEIREKVDFVNSNIQIENKQAEIVLKNELKQMIDIIYQITDSTYHQYKDKLPLEQIRQKVKENISYVNYNNQNYFYIIEYSTNIVYSHPTKKYEGMDFSNGVDVRGVNRIQALKDSLKNGDKIGFEKIYFYKLGESKIEYPKLTAVFHYKPLDFLVGTGEYIDMVEDRLKNQLIKKIEILNSSQSSKEINIFELDDETKQIKALIKDNGNGVKNDHILNPNEHNKYIKELIYSIDKKDSGYFEYKATNPQSNNKVKKYIYYKYYKDWNWLIYSSFYHDEMDSSLELLKEKIDSEEKSIFASSLILIITIIIITLLISFFVLNKLKNIFISYAKEINTKKEELEIIFSTIKDGIAIVDKNTNFLYFNDGFSKMLGYEKKELSSMSCLQLTALEDVSRVKEAISETKQKGFVENFEKTYIVKANRRVSVNMSLALMPDKENLLISIKDITEGKRKEKEIQNYVSLIDKNIMISSTNIDGRMVHVSEAFAKISGYEKDELIGQDHSIMRHPDMKKEFFKAMWKVLNSNKIWHGEIKNKTKDGGYYWSDMSISPNFDEYGHKIGYTAIRHDITNKKLIEELSITDSLTEVFNRRHFDDIIPKVINSAKRKDELLSFIIMDIDHFKQYNDTYGHQEGDNALKAVSKSVKETLNRADDHCFRLGGEEFGVIFKSVDIKSAVDFSHKIKQNIEDLQIIHEKNSASKYITVSMGLICEYASKIKDKDELYKLGDDLLYKAKASGRNKICTLLEEER